MRTAVLEQFPDPAVPWLSYELEGVSDWATLVGAVFVLLAQLVPCDEVVWNGVDRLTRRALVASSVEDYTDDETRLLLELDDHPMVNHFLAPDRSKALVPVRLGDLVSDRGFRGTRTWSDLFGPRGFNRQVTVATGFNVGQTAGTAWSLNRGGAEYTDDEVALIGSVAPLLGALEVSERWQPDPEYGEDAHKMIPWAMRGQSVLRGAPPLAALTDRELQVLGLLADGLTAAAIGHRLRISVKTVRKHLEHVYNKTGQRDRLMAVAYAKKVGLL